MDRIYNLIAFLFLSFCAFSQTFEGTYQEGDDILKFNNNRIYFDVDEIGSMTNKVGEGTYEQVGDFLLVLTDDFAGERTTVQPLSASKKDTIVIKVTDHQNSPIQGVLVESLNASDKILLGGVTNNNGRVLFLHNSKIAKFRIFNMGFDNVTFDFKPANDFVVKMVNKVIVEKKTAVFKIKQLDDETLALLLLSTDFDPGKNRQKALEKLENKAKKRNFIDKRLKKEYVPYTRQP